MLIHEQEYIEGQLKKRWPDFDKQFPYNDRDGHDAGYAKCLQVYGSLQGDIDNWVLEELVDADTYKVHWFWRRKH